MAVNSPKTKQDQNHQHLSHSNLKQDSVLPVSSTPHHFSIGNPNTPQASRQASPGTHHIRGLSSSEIDRPNPSPRTSSKETLTAYSLMNKLEGPYFAIPSWSFTAPATSHTEFATSSRPSSISQGAPRLGGTPSASASMPLSRFSSLSQGPRLLPRPTITDFTDDDDSADEGNLALWMAQDAEDEMRRLSQAISNSRAATSRRSCTLILRNLPIIPPFVTLDSFTYNDILLAEKVYVELKDKDFLRIVHIIQNTSTSAVTLRGWKFRRTRELNGVIDRKLNEVCWIFHIDDDDPRDARLQSMETVPVCEIVKRRRIRLTNQSFPALSWRDDGDKEKPETIENHRVLVCRFKYLCFYADAKARAAYNWSEKGFHRLRENECDQRPDNNMRDEELRNIWRGCTVLGGAQEGWLPGEKEYLRQEDVSHRGITSRASLKAPAGPDFPMGDPMKRGSVGSIFTEYDLQSKSGRATQNSSLGSNDLVMTDSTSHSRERQQGRRISQFILSGFNGLPIDPGDSDAHEDQGISAMRRGLRQSSIQAQEFSDRSPRIVEIDAQVKTSSSSGTFEKRYEGKITSKYYPTPRMAQRKRSADISFGSPARPTKRVHQGFWAEPRTGDRQNKISGQGCRNISDDIKRAYQESLSSDSDRIFDRSQSPDSVEEGPLKSRGYKTSISGLLTPVSRRKDSAIPQSKDLVLPPRMAGFTEYSQPSKPFFRIARSSVVHARQACRTTEDDNGVVDLTRSQTERSRLQNQATTIKTPASKAKQRRYTFGDCFCGAGGMSRGAVSAGLRVHWGFDFNPAACQTFQMNFFGTPVYNVWANQFSEAKGDHKVDICHLSPPCQFFSDAHTIQGKDDDMNTASLFAIFNLLEKAKPRVVTLEQTSGLIRRHPIFFNAVINMFTSRGFSVRWRVMNCADFGLPQHRSRLFIMASW